MNESITLNTFSRITPLEKLNENFTLCECYAFALGKNRNFSCIDKEAAENALYGMDYLPIVAHLIQKEDGSYYIGGHDYDIDWDSEDGWKFKPMTVPVGVVIANSAEYRDVEEYGKTVTYVVVKCILWTEHYPELLEAAYSDEVYFSQSMEIAVNQSRPLEEDSNYTEILEFTFLKLCLLGLSDNPNENTEPCFISAKVLPTEFSANPQDDMMEELKAVLDSYYAKKEENALDNKEEMTEEEISPEATAEEASTEEAEIEDKSEFAKKDEPEELPEDEPKEDEGPEDKPEEDEDPEEPEDEVDGEDDDDKKFEEAVNPAPDYAALLAERENQLSELDNKYCELLDKYNEVVKKYNELVEFKANYDRQEYAKKVDAVLAEFEDMIGVSEFDSFALSAYSMDSIEAIESKCYELRGRFGKMRKEKKVEKVTVPVVNKEKVDDYYGDFFTRY